MDKRVFSAPCVKSLPQRKHVGIGSKYLALDSIRTDKLNDCSC
jgi:hypothetical protein